MYSQLPVSLIRKGEEYSLKIQIKFGNDIITPENTIDVRIKIGNFIRSYLKGELTFENGYWLFPISQEFTLNYNGDLLLAQSQFKLTNNEIYETKIYKIKVENSLFNEVWE